VPGVRSLHAQLILQASQRRWSVGSGRFLRDSNGPLAFNCKPKYLAPIFWSKSRLRFGRLSLVIWADRLELRCNSVNLPPQMYDDVSESDRGQRYWSLPAFVIWLFDQRDFHRVHQIYERCSCRIERIQRTVGKRFDFHRGAARRADCGDRCRSVGLRNQICGDCRFLHGKDPVRYAKIIVVIKARQPYVLSAGPATSFCTGLF
jgi:hypothetical protein